ncbi:hypothetical protein [Sporosarcina aquimarina]|uniref:hypothetical protein n=1 Tax=Sporosarcina aquimarina TaxID=114975 RepID=UPI0020403D3E|nr:hypothetical protein [Sporosarcina aquimarina]
MSRYRETPLCVGEIGLCDEEPCPSDEQSTPSDGQSHATDREQSQPSHNLKAHPSTSAALPINPLITLICVSLPINFPLVPILCVNLPISLIIFPIHGSKLPIATFILPIPLATTPAQHKNPASQTHQPAGSPILIHLILSSLQSN